MRSLSLYYPPFETVPQACSPRGVRPSDEVDGVSTRQAQNDPRRCRCAHRAVAVPWTRCRAHSHVHAPQQPRPRAVCAQDRPASQTCARVHRDADAQVGKHKTTRSPRASRAPSSVPALLCIPARPRPAESRGSAQGCTGSTRSSERQLKTDPQAAGVREGVAGSSSSSSCGQMGGRPAPPPRRESEATCSPAHLPTARPSRPPATPGNVSACPPTARQPDARPPHCDTV